MKPPWKFLTLADQLLIACLALLGVLGLAWSLSAPRGQRVMVSVSDRLVYLGSLDKEDMVELSGPVGKTVLTVDHQGARITAAPCPLKVCMTMGPAVQQGDILTCVPNRVLVEIEGGASQPADYDLLSH
ncbi:MAG: NusG domain II-containing protein [Deltaproteobacteria bacterium]|jgi:hypothetical protein|nr:NusG domain II-containing protein [Deltaproteobacteria bacterium]